MTRGTDITEAFEASHVVNTKYVESVLAKHYVQDATTPRMSPYTFKPAGFYMTMKKKIQPILEEVGTGPTLTVRLFNDALILTAFAMVLLGIRLESRILQILAGFVLTLGVNASHNFVHLKQNWRTYYWDLSLLSSYEFRAMHALSHHLYPNTVMDAEVSMLEPLLMFLPSKDKSGIQRFGVIVYVHFLFISFFVAFVRRVKKIIQGTQKLRPENLLVILELALFITVAPNVLYGIQAWLIFHAACGYLFMMIAVGVAHHHPDIFHDGDEARPDPDFGLCQLDAVRDRMGTLHENLFVQMVIYGEHSLHHLFPTICHSKLHHLTRGFEGTLKEFAELYPKMTHWQLFVGAFKQLQRTDPKKLKGN